MVQVAKAAFGKRIFQRGLTASQSTTPSGVWGAGFQNAGSIHPTNSSLWLIAADVAGVHLSTDAGLSWTPANKGLDSSQKLHGVAIVWSETNSTRAYYYSCAAQPGSATNYLFAGDYAADLGTVTGWWIVRQVPGGWASGDNGAQAGDTQADLVSGHPRQSKSRMLGLDEAQGLAYICSADGLWRVALDGLSEPVRVWGAGQSLTAIALDPLDKNTAYVTVDLGTLTGVHKLVGVRTTPTVTSHRPTAYQYAQSVKAVVKDGVTRLFVATGRASSASSPADSVVFWSGGTFTSGWVDITGNLNADETSQVHRWAGVDAVVLAGGSYRILAAHSYDVTGSTGKRVGWTDWSGSGTPTWTKPSASTVDLQYRVGDSSGAVWWLAASQGGLMLDKAAYDSVDPQIAPSDHEVWMMPGRSGVWRRSGAGALWHPAVKGTAVTTSWDVLASRVTPANVIYGDVDWTILRSVDGMVTQPMPANRPQSGDCRMVAQSETASTVAIAIGARDANSGGGVWSTANPWVGDDPAWTDELNTGSGRLWAGTSSTPQCKGVAVGADGSGAQVILAAMRGSSGVSSSLSGLWRKVGAGSAGAWSKITLPGYPGTGGEFYTSSNDLRHRFAWQPGGGSTVWLCDPLSGLWRSGDYGATWTRHRSETWTSREGCDVVGDPTRAGVYYAVTRIGAAWKITDGNTATPTIAAMNTAAAKAAAVTVHRTSGNVYLAETTAARLWKSADGGAVWSDITTPSWEAMCGTVKALDVASNGTLHVAMFAGYSTTSVE